MNWKEFYALAQSGLAFSDGSMGVFLQKYGLKGGDCPELWNVEHPDIVEQVHRSYIEAGSNLLITNSLGANALKLEEFRLSHRLEEFNAAAVKVAKKAAGGKAIVAGDIGPTGQFVEPLGTVPFEMMVEVYKQQILALANAGVDCLFFETHIDLFELKAGIIAAKECCDLPIIASVTFEADGRTVTGSSPEAVFVTLEALGVDILGTNCGMGPAQMLEIVRKAREWVNIPIIAQANAGLPQLIDGKTQFTETPETFVPFALKMMECGVGAVGGCCGTTPEHIKLLVDSAKSKKPYQLYHPLKRNRLVITSRYQTASIGPAEPFCVIGERLNPTARKALAADIQSGAYSLFRDEARAQELAGAGILDLNMGIPNIDEAAVMKKGVELLSMGVKIPQAIDTSTPAAAIAGMRYYAGRPLLNSITAESDRLELLPEIRKYGAGVIVLPIDEKGIPAKAEDRVRVMRRIMDAAKKAGVDPSCFVADPLVMTVSADSSAARETLKTLRMFRDELGLHTTMGLSNVSFGLPARAFVNRTFLAMAIDEGLSSAIANPLDAELMGTVRAADVLSMRDDRAMRYVEYYTQNPVTPAAASAAPGAVKTSQSKPEAAPATLEEKLFDSILKGRKESVPGLIDEALKSGKTPSDLLDRHFIPAITKAGEYFEAKTFFLPQLMLSAEAMQAAFGILEPILKKAGAETRGKMVFATVQGDVHDIGKNIVTLMLKNFGYEIIDLGKDVSALKIVETALKENADAIGLSALMTTTMPRMEEVMGLLSQKKMDVPVMVGGAAVTRTFAESIGAHYARDAVDAVRVTQEVLKQKR